MLTVCLQRCSVAAQRALAAAEVWACVIVAVAANICMASHDVAACRLVETLAPFAGMQHLDVAGGTGDVAFRVLRAIQTAEQIDRQLPQQPQQWQAHQAQQQAGQQQQEQHQQQQGAVTVFDINAEMLEVGKQRARAQGELSQQRVTCRTMQDNVIMALHDEHGCCVDGKQCCCSLLWYNVQPSTPGVVL